MTPRVVASAILCRYCLKEAFEKALDRRFLDPTNYVVISDGTTDEHAHQISITSAAYDQLRSLASELMLPALAAGASTQDDTVRDVASGILCHYCSKEAFEKAQAG